MLATARTMFLRNLSARRHPLGPAPEWCGWIFSAKARHTDFGGEVGRGPFLSTFFGKTKEDVASSTPSKKRQADETGPPQASKAAKRPCEKGKLIKPSIPCEKGNLAQPNRPCENGNLVEPGEQGSALLESQPRGHVHLDKHQKVSPAECGVLKRFRRKGKPADQSQPCRESAEVSHSRPCEKENLAQPSKACEKGNPAEPSKACEKGNPAEPSKACEKGNTAEHSKPLKKRGRSEACDKGNPAEASQPCEKVNPAEPSKAASRAKRRRERGTGTPAPPPPLAATPAKKITAPEAENTLSPEKLEKPIANATLGWPEQNKTLNVTSLKWMSLWPRGSTNLRKCKGLTLPA